MRLPNGRRLTVCIEIALFGTFYRKVYKQILHLGLMAFEPLLTDHYIESILLKLGPMHMKCNDQNVYHQNAKYTWIT